METCYGCSITEKLELCCRVNPETGKSVLLKLDKGFFVYAYPNLGRDELCQNYNNGPEICEEFLCEKINSLSLCDIFSSNR